MSNIENEGTPEAQAASGQKVNLEELLKQEAQAVTKMLLGWAQKQSERILRSMEIQGHPLTKGEFKWSYIKRGWTGGFASGVQAGYQLAHSMQNKLTEQFLDQSRALTPVAGDEIPAPIETPTEQTEAEANGQERLPTL